MTVANGYAHFRIGNDEMVIPNWTPCDDVLECINRSVAGSKPAVVYPRPWMSPFFLRHSALRSKRDNTYISGNAVGSTIDAMYRIPSVSTWYDNPQRRRKYHNTITWATTDQPCAFGSLGNYADDFGYVTNGYYISNTTVYGHPASSFYDVPGTKIGAVHTHPASGYGGSVFNEIGVIPYSQGSIVLGGQFNPAENQLGHKSYRVYYAKSGGTGAIDGTVGYQTNGATDGVSDPNRFADASAGGHFVDGTHDDGTWYIAIRGQTGGNTINNGTFKILNVIDTNTVEIDSEAINQNLVTVASDVSWTLRKGPIGEYLFQRRGSATGAQYFTSSLYAGPTNMGCCYTYYGQNQLKNTHDTSNYMQPTRQVHDRGAHVWWVCPQVPALSTAYPLGLMRKLVLSPEGMDPVYKDGSIKNASYFGETATADMPAGITQWCDIRIDTQNKIWVCWRAAPTSPDQYKRIVRIDPYPTVAGSPNSKYPKVMGIWESQSSVTDAAGLCSDKPVGIVCDNTNGVTWVFHIAGTRLGGTTIDNGGISYTQDGGTTWKRLHRLHSRSGTVDITGDGTAVVGVSGTLFDTEFAVGDWVRFASDTRSYEITGIADSSHMTIAPARALGTGFSIQKGVLSDAEARLYINYTPYGYWNVDNQNVPPCDYDTTGSIFWIPSGRDRICKFNLSTGTVQVILRTELRTGGYAYDDTLKNLTVSRVPTNAIAADHPLHNDVWVGTYQMGMARIPASSFTGALATRIHWSVNDVKVGGDIQSIKLQYTGSVTVHTSGRAIVDPNSGQIYLIFIGEAASGEVRHYNVYMYPINDANGFIGRLIWNASPTYNTAGNVDTPLRIVPHSINFDDVGNGMCYMPCFTINNQGDYTLWHYGPYQSFAWNGTAWGKVVGNQHSYNLDFAKINTYPGPYVYNSATIAVGTGLKRVHEDPQPLADGVTIKFVDATGAVLPENQYIIDEHSTFTCYIGSGKDNTQDMSLYTDVHVSPTVYRLATEPVIDTRNWWTQDWGCDGGWIDSTDLQATPNFCRGVAEMVYCSAYGGVSNVPTFYPNFYSGTGQSNCNSPRDFHAMIALRIPDEGEYAGDGSFNTAQNTFNTAGAYTFTDNDIGKSIIVEGANGASLDPDNGQAVIMLRNSATQVVTDKTWTNSRTGMRWKLRNIPKIGYVVAGYENVSLDKSAIYLGWYLYKSANLGVSWVQTKKMDMLYGVSANEAISVKQDYNVFLDCHFLHQNNAANTETTSVVFKLTDIDHNLRRRQYWKVYRNNIQNVGDTIRFASMAVYDDNFRLLGVANNKLADKDDPAWVAAWGTVSLVPYKPGATDYLSAIDDGDGDTWTNTLQLTSGSFYEATGTTNGSVRSTGRFICTAATFTKTDVGKALRIPGATLNPADPTWSKYAAITQYVSSTEVQTDRVFVDADNLDWAKTAIAYGDSIQFTFSGMFADNRYLNIKDYMPVILDVPTSNTLKITTADAPLAMANYPFYIVRAFPNGGMTLGRSYPVDGNTALCSYMDSRYGVLSVSDTVEFITMTGPTSGATTPADDDGDARTEWITIPGDITADCVAGDYVLLTGTGGRRVYEITSASYSSPNTTLKVKYDELRCGGTFTYTILRKRHWKFVANKVVVTAETQLV